MSMLISREQPGGGGPTTSPDLILGWEQARAGTSSTQDIIGGGVAVTAGAARPRSGTLSLFYMDEAAAAAGFNLHQPAGPYTLTDLTAPGSWREMQYVIAPGGCTITLDPTTRRRWVVQVAYQELQGVEL